MTATAEALRFELPGLGLRLAALAWGDARAPALLALHGWLDNAASFAALAPRLADRRRVIALDLPGHGHSAHLPPAGRYDLAFYVRSVHETVQTLGIDTCDLLGHSLGGAVASLYAAAFPGQVRRLALVEALGPMADAGDDTLVRWRAGLAADASRPARTFDSTARALAARCRATGQHPEAIRPIVERGLRETSGGFAWRSDARLTATTPVRMAESQVHALLAGIEAPTLLLMAEPESPFLPHALLRMRATRVADIRVDVLHGGHHLHAEDPEAVAARLSPFLHGQEP